MAARGVRRLGNRTAMSASSRLDEFFEGLPPRLDVNDVAALLGVSTKGVYTWVQQGVIPAYKVGSSWLILRDELKDVMAQGSNLTPGASLSTPAEEESEDEPEDEPNADG